jgi:hypothetical protein
VGAWEWFGIALFAGCNKSWQVSLRRRQVSKNEWIFWLALMREMAGGLTLIAYVGSV